MQTDYHAQLDALNQELAQLDAEFTAITRNSPDPSIPGGVIQSAIRLIQMGTRLLDEQSRLAQIVEGLERYYTQSQQAWAARADVERVRQLMKRIDALKDRAQLTAFEFERTVNSSAKNDTFRALISSGVPDPVLKSIEHAAVESVDALATV